MALAAQVKLVDRGLMTNPDSLWRQRRATSFLADATRDGGKVDWEVIKAILADEFGKPSGILRSPRVVSHDSISATVATTLMDPGGRTMWVARKPYESREFVGYRL